jgi:hypothetical protein
MAGKIFINYHRGDDAGFTQALYMRLEDDFASADLFMDVEGHIKPGDDFVEALNAQVAAARWLFPLLPLELAVGIVFDATYQSDRDCLFMNELVGLWLAAPAYYFQLQECSVPG